MTRQERLTRVKERFLKDGRRTRLGGLAANLSRVHSFSNNVQHRAAVEDLIVESEHFIEWAAPDCDLMDMERLAQVQLELAQWRRGLSLVWDDEVERANIAELARVRSQEMLEMSGLLEVDGR